MSSVGTVAQWHSGTVGGMSVRTTFEFIKWFRFAVIVDTNNYISTLNKKNVNNSILFYLKTSQENVKVVDELQKTKINL